MSQTWGQLTKQAFNIHIKCQGKSGNTISAKDTLLLHLVGTASWTNKNIRENKTIWPIIHTFPAKMFEILLTPKHYISRVDLLTTYQLLSARLLLIILNHM